jgi:hypothetical protein
MKMTKKIEFYRTDLYPSWEDAHANGGVHSTNVTAEYDDDAVKDVTLAIHAACKMAIRCGYCKQQAVDGKCVTCNCRVWEIDTRVVVAEPQLINLNIFVPDKNDIVRIVWDHEGKGESGFTQIEAWKAQTELHFLYSKGCRIHSVGPAIDNTGE